MEVGSLIDVKEYTGTDFKRLVESDSWSVAMLRYSDRFSKFEVLERHLKTDEVFVLQTGRATLCVRNDTTGKTETAELESLRVYNVPRGVWHHIVVSEDASVLVVENRNTSKDNTERRDVVC